SVEGEQPIGVQAEVQLAEPGSVLEVAAPDHRLHVVLEENRLRQPREVGGRREVIHYGAIESLATNQIFEEAPQGRRVESAYRQRHRPDQAHRQLREKGDRWLPGDLERERIGAS